VIKILHCLKIHYYSLKLSCLQTYPIYYKKSCIQQFWKLQLNIKKVEKYNNKKVLSIFCCQKHLYMTMCWVKFFINHCQYGHKCFNVFRQLKYEPLKWISPMFSQHIWNIVCSKMWLSKEKNWTYTLSSVLPLTL